MSRVADMLGKLFAGLLLDLVQKLSGEDGEMWYEALKKFLRKENPWSDIWKTIQVGTHSSIAELRQALVDAGCRISDWADSILAKVALATKQTSIDLVIVSVAELGFPNGATLKQIYKAALKKGYLLCPPEVGPQLRLQYAKDDQPLDEWLIIAMEPIADSDGYLNVFNVVRDEGDLWLYSSYGGPGNFYDPESRLVFRRK